jgi:uncharacterized repeat protein (TIGR01451 family)
MLRSLQYDEVQAMNALIVRGWRTTCLAVLAVLLVCPAELFAAADVEVRKTVDNPTPAFGQPVEFTVQVRNIGTTDAVGVKIQEKLPVDMRVPTGMSIFVSTGHLDPVTNEWSIGNLAPGGSATLVAPAIFAVAQQPVCSVNVAQTKDFSDGNAANDRAYAAVKRVATDHCVDVTATFRSVSLPVCGTRRSFDFFVDVANNGPDEARNVIVDLSQSPPLAPGLRFVGAGCTGTRCIIASLPAGSTRMFQVLSADFSNGAYRTLTFTLVATSSDFDFAPANNESSVDVSLPPFYSCDDEYGDPGYYIGGGCFIATAAYGSPFEPHVVALRQFRDRFLQRSELGRTFVRYYYRYSPPLAQYIGAHPAARFAARVALAPIVALVVYPVRSLAVGILALAMLFMWRRRAVGDAASQR